MQFLTVCLFIAVCIELFQKLFTSIDQLIKIAMTLFRLYVGLRIHFFSSTNSATKNGTYPFQLTSYRKKSVPPQCNSAKNITTSPIAATDPLGKYFELV